MSRVLCFLAGSAAKPVLTFRPNYSPIFVGENIKMTCDSLPKAKEYDYYRDETHIYKGEVLELSSVGIRNSGKYRCQTRDGSKSDEVTLRVVDGSLVLQSPPYIHEGDRLNLKCHNNPKTTARRSKFSKGNALLRDWDNNYLYSKGNAQKDDAGEYSCRKEIVQDLKVTEYTATASVLVKELFTAPKINVTSKPDGSKTLTCRTEISSYKPSTEPHYGFYKNGELLQKFDQTNVYQIPANQLKTPGNYSCTVRPKSSSVTKTSNKVAISKSPALIQNLSGLALCECALLVSFIFIT